MKRRGQIYIIIEEKGYIVKNYKEAKKQIYLHGIKGKIYTSTKVDTETGVITERYEYNYINKGIIYIKKTYSLIEEQIKRSEKRQLKLFDI